MANTENNWMKGIKFRFDLTSFLIFLLIFVVEVLIALFVNDSIIRPFGGDLLVVILLYYFVKSFIQVKSLTLCLAVLLFAYLIEIGQYFNLVEILGMQEHKIMRIVIGSSFSWGDIIAYTAGAIICFIVDRKNNE